MSKEKETRNVLYIMTDQQRYDTLSCNGATFSQTPNLDDLAAEGTRFERAYSVCALCSPARTSMLTGLYPHNHRMWNNNDMMQWAIRDLADDVRVISQDFVDAGYNCGYTGKWHCGEKKVPSSYGFIGMDVPNYGNPSATKEYANYLAANGLGRPEPMERVLGGATMSGPPEASPTWFLGEHASNLLEQFNSDLEDNDRPFMLFVSIWGPHAAYNIPEPYASMYNPADIPPWPNMQDTLAGKPAAHRRFRRTWGRDAPWKMWQKAVAHYWGYCSLIDDVIGRLLNRLRELGRWDDTAILFSTDHGDMTGSHGGFFDKGPFMYEETYHIPQIVRIPGAEAGAVSDRFVTNMDLAATALDTAGLPIPENFDARSLAPLAFDADSDWPDDVYVEFHGHRFLYSQRMVRWGSYKYVYNASDEDELYDLAEDPAELNNCIQEAKYQPIAEEGRQRIWNWVQASNDPIRGAAGGQLGRR